MTRYESNSVGSAETEGTIFEALWAPRWFGQDQGLAQGQEGTFAFRGPVPPPTNAFVVLAAGLEKPRYEARCRVLGLSHPQLGKLQAIQVDRSEYVFALSDGDPLQVKSDGSLLDPQRLAPPDWTVRVIFEVLD